MELITPFNLNFYKFTCQDALTDRILSKVIPLDFTKNESNSTTLMDNFFDEELVSWFEKCIDEAKTDIGFNENIKLPITICWANKTSKLQAHHEHAHPNSFLSGIFYLTSHTDAPTTFVYPSYWFNQYPGIDFFNSKKHRYVHQILPVKSTLILFPSHIRHGVVGHKNPEVRYTISFNTFLSGKICDDSFNKIRLELNVKTLRDYQNES